VEFEYYWNGAGPIYSPCFNADATGRFSTYYGPSTTNFGTYQFTKVRNANGGQWNNINTVVVLNAP